jgi:predicted GNAT family acetyltransferase
MAGPRDKLDDALENTFPASDPLANTPETGIRLEPDRGGDDGKGVQDNVGASRFELHVGGQVATLLYERRGHDQMVLVHTEVPEPLRGRRLGDRLAKAALDTARREQRRVIAVCPFVRAYLRRHARGQS